MRVPGFLAAVVAAAMLFLPAAAQADGGLVAAYGLDEVSGTVATDASGTGNTGAIAGATRVTGGKFGGALSFDGIDDRVDIADSNSLDLATGMTLEAWVDPDGLVGNWRTVLIKEQPAALAYALYAGEDNARPSAHAFTSTEFDTRGTSSVALNVWSHLAATYDGATLRLYVNGTQVSSRAVSGAMASSSGALRIGGNAVWGEYFKGLIDEVRVYSRALSPSEIQGDMNTSVAPPADTQAPTAPTGVTATMDGLDVDVAWDASTDNTGVTRYRVLRSDDSIVTTTPDGATLSAVDHRPAAGNRSYTVVAYDAAGNVSAASAPGSVTVPDAVPQISINSPSEGATISGGENQLTATVTDDAGTVTVQYKLDGADYGAPITASTSGGFQRGLDVTSVPNGAHTLTAVVRDAADQEGTSAARHITVDNGTARSIAITAPTNGSSVSGTVQLAMTATGGLSSDRIAWRVNGAVVDVPRRAIDPQPTWSTTSLADGTYTIKASVLDFGVEVASDTVVVTVANTTPPTQPENLTATVNRQRVDLSWTASTDDTGVARYRVYRSDTSGFTPSASTLIGTVTGSQLSYADQRVAPGTFYWAVVAEDAANSRSTPSAEASGTVEDVAPQILITSPFENEWYPDGGQVGISAIVYDNPGIETVRFKFDDTELGDPVSGDPALVTFGRAFSTAFATAGDHTVTVIARDAAGNETAKTIHFEVRTGDPRSVDISAPADGATISGTVTLGASWAGGLDTDKLAWTANGTSLGAGRLHTDPAQTWDTTTVPNGQYTLKATVSTFQTAMVSDTITVTVSNVPVAPPGPVASYGFDEAAGTSVTDGSGGGHPGTISGATRSAAGKFGGALSFDGVNDLVTVPDANAFDLSTGMTLEAWVRPTTLNGSWRTVMLKEQPGALVYALYAGADNGRASAHAFTSTEFDTRATSALPLNAWSHLAMTYDGANLRLFVNGTQVSSRALTGAMISSSGALRIGGNMVWGEYFKGLIDEVRVYNRALPAAELQADAAHAVSGG